ncbi:MAG: hypothetical protein NW224_15015 [Leptolyngbyaceae cyanobacterium bins.302]|nr:hypothetical protein [Leptolyngbyaceae cyanobacterium bins.302]
MRRSEVIHRPLAAVTFIVDLWGLAQKYDQTALIHSITHQYTLLQEQAKVKP